MNYGNLLEDMLESIPDYLKKVISIFLLQNIRKLLLEVGFNEHDINRLNLEFKNILIEQYEDYLDYVKNEKKSLIENFLNK